MDISDGDSDVDSDYNSVDAEQDRDEDVPELTVGGIRESALIHVNSSRRRNASDAYKTLLQSDISAIKSQILKAQAHNNRGLFTCMISKGKSPVSTSVDGRARRKTDGEQTAKVAAKAIKDAATAVATTMQLHVGTVGSAEHLEINTAKTAKAKASSKGGKAASMAKSAQGKASAGKAAVAAKASRSAKVSPKAAARAASSSSSSSSVATSSGKKKARKVLSAVFGSAISKALVAGVGTKDVDSFAESATTTTTTSSGSGSNGNGKGKGKGKGKGNGSRGSSRTEPVAAASSSAAAVPVRRARKALPAATSAAIARACRGIKTKTIVIETKRFAGQEITVSRTEYSSQGAGDLGEPTMVKDQFENDDKGEPALHAKASKSASSAAGKQPAGSGKRGAVGGSASAGGDKGLDSVLEAIKGPQAINTVTKSAFDWQQHKVKEGLEDELKGAADAGYLARRDFLNRVDVRTYEKERDARIIDQASRKK